MDDSLFKLSKFHSLLKTWKETSNPLYEAFYPSKDIIESIIIMRDNKFASEYYNVIVSNSEKFRTKENSVIIDKVYKAYLDIMGMNKTNIKEEKKDVPAVVPNDKSIDTPKDSKS